MDQKTVLIDHLQIILAAEFMFFVKISNFHWNVKGTHFGPLHGLFKQGYEETFEVVDLIAEWIVQLGYDADGTMHDFQKKSFLKESFEKNLSAQKMLEILHMDIRKIIDFYNQLGLYTSQDFVDLATNNFIINLIEKRMKYKWFLKSHLES